MRQYRFFYHFYKKKGKMSVHFRNTCSVVDDIVCLVPCETKWNKTQPRFVMRGFAKEIRFRKGTAIIT